MAEAVKSRPARYGAVGATYGNVAYDMSYGGGATRPLERGGEVLRPQPRVRPREKSLTRPVVRVREAGHVSPFAVVGFLAVGVFAVLLLMSYVQLTVAADQVVGLKSQLETLQAEHVKLSAQYELTYDLGSIEAQVTADGSMVKAAPSQIFTIDLSAPDSVLHYSDAAVETGDGVTLWTQAGNFFDGLLAYFK